MKGDVKILMGDFNTKIGKGEVYQPIITAHSLLDRSNENGELVVNFSAERTLRIVRTFTTIRFFTKGRN